MFFSPTAGGLWVPLGSAILAVNAVTVGPVVWTGAYSKIWIHYYIEGYNGGTPVGRALVAAGIPSTVALTNGSNIVETAVTVAQAASTSTPSIPGIPLAVTLSAISRQGNILFAGASGKFKRYQVQGQNGAQSVAAPVTMFRGSGCFSDLGANLPLQQAQLTVYDTLVAVAPSAQLFLAGTSIDVYGCL